MLATPTRQANKWIQHLRTEGDSITGARADQTARALFLWPEPTAQL